MSHKNAAYDLTPLGYINSNLESGLTATLSGFAVNPANPQNFNDDDESTQTGAADIAQDQTALILYDLGKEMLLSNVYLNFSIVAALDLGALTKTYVYLDVSKDNANYHSQQVGYISMNVVGDASASVNAFFDVWRKVRYVRVKL